MEQGLITIAPQGEIEERLMNTDKGRYGLRAPNEFCRKRLAFDVGTRKNALSSREGIECRERQLIAVKALLT